MGVFIDTAIVNSYFVICITVLYIDTAIMNSYLHYDRVYRPNQNLIKRNLTKLIKPNLT